MTAALLAVVGMIGAAVFGALFLALYPVALCRVVVGAWPWQRKDAWEWTETYCASVYGSRVRPWPGDRDE